MCSKTVVIMQKYCCCNAGDQYYRYTRGSSVNNGYPRDLSLWKGLPSTIDAAFEWGNEKTYFFTGPNYYRFNDYAFEVCACAIVLVSKG